MKTKLLTLIILAISVSGYAQTAFDKIYTNDKIIECTIKEVTPDAVKFCYPNEDLVNSIYKNSILKIEYKSGRVEEFAEATSFKTVRSGADWENVSITQIESEVKGLFKLEDVSSKAKGTTAIANVNKVKDRAMKKLKIEAAMMGGNIIYITQQDTRGNLFGSEYQASQPTETNYAGVAYTNKRPSFSEFQALYETKKQFQYLSKEFLGNNSPDLESTKPKTYNVTINGIEDEKGFIYVYADIPGEESNKFRVSYFDQEVVVLMYQDKRKIYNLVLGI